MPSLPVAGAGPWEVSDDFGDTFEREPDGAEGCFDFI
jgi:hypothetical protein